VDGCHALDLDRDPAAAIVPAHQIDRPYVGRPLAPDEAELISEHGRLRGQLLLQIAFDAVLLERSRIELVSGVAQPLEQANLEAILRLPGALANDHQAGSSSITVGGVIQLRGGIRPPS